MGSKIRLQQVSIDSISTRELLEKIKTLCSRNEKSVVSHVNVHGINISNRLSWYRDFLNQATINFCDGDGVRLGARLLGMKIEEKITYNRFIWELAELSQQEEFSWYLVGSEHATINCAVNVLGAKYPKLKIAGFRSGFFKSEKELDELYTEISSRSPDILIVGMGMPIQEEFLVKNFEKLDFRIAMTAGAVFEYVAGNAKMTPDIFYNLKLEWLYRFLNDPKRLFIRYFIGNPLFIARVIRERFWKARKGQ